MRDKLTRLLLAFALVGAAFESAAALVLVVLVVV
jgi:hypothetical protein